jgi:lipopolysaccharide biosynthesis glycosyltransferase
MCADSNYFQHIAACLVSLLESNVDVNFSVVVLATKLAPDARDKLLRSLQRYPNISLRIEKFDVPSLSSLPLVGRYPSEIYARFWVQDYFGADVDRVIYLDGDMVIIDSIVPLLEIDLTDKMLAAVAIPGSVSPSRLGYDSAFGYFNSGVLVINLQKWRADGAHELLINTTFALKDRLNDPDQDVLNYCFHQQYVQLDYVWNAISPFFKEVNGLTLSQQEIKRVAREARIVHFNGRAKPWNYLSFHPHSKEYLRCVEQTEWRGFVPRDYSRVNFFKKRVIQLLGERRAGELMKALRSIKAIVRKPVSDPLSKTSSRNTP